MYQLLDKRTRESLSRAVSLGDICLSLSFDLYNQLKEVSSGGLGLDCHFSYLLLRKSHQVMLDDLDETQRTRQ
jgi:hypothetical protein